MKERSIKVIRYILLFTLYFPLWVLYILIYVFYPIHYIICEHKILNWFKFIMTEYYNHDWEFNDEFDIY